MNTVYAGFSGPLDRRPGRFPCESVFLSLKCQPPADFQFRHTAGNGFGHARLFSGAGTRERNKATESDQSRWCSCCHRPLTIPLLEKQRLVALDEILTALERPDLTISHKLHNTFIGTEIEQRIRIGRLPASKNETSPGTSLATH